MAVNFQWRLRVWTRFHETPDRVWAMKVDPERIRDEFRPWLRFSLPDDVLDRGLRGELPVSFDARLTPPGLAWPGRLVAIQDGVSFVDESENRLMAAWRHEHTVEPTGDGCRYIDDVQFSPRGPLPALHVAHATALLFRHRHLRFARGLDHDARATAVIVLREVLDEEQGAA
ncbi:MAG: hypothetical protein H6742_12685 [Alphaproteobacteria bacterium]|nr:hypothetical protein [Alphaproteobacteria bacterium]